MKFIAIANILISLLGAILEAVKAAEKAIPGAGKGTEKLALVRATLEAAYEFSTDALPVFEEIWGAISKVVSAVVSAYNRTGVFAK